MQRLKVLVNVFESKVENCSILTNKQKCSFKENNYGNDRYAIETDFLKLFILETNQSFGIHYYFLDEKGSTLPDHLQSMEVSLKTDDQHLHSLNFPVNTFRALLKEVNTAILDDTNSTAQEHAEHVVDVLCRVFKLNQKSAENNINSLLDACLVETQDTVNDLKHHIKTKAELKCEIKTKEREISNYRHNSDEANEIYRLEIELRKRREKFLNTVSQKADDLKIDQSRTKLAQAQQDISYSRELIKSQVTEINKDYQLGKKEQNIIFKTLTDDV